MNEMIERVATNFWLHMSFEQDPKLFKRQDRFIIKHYVEAARLAIEAMREPTEDQIKAGFGQGGYHLSYTAMIDAALKE